MVAALKTIEILERDKVIESIWAKGEKFMGDLKAVVAKSGVDAHVSGIAPMQFITFNKDPQKTYKEKKNRFLYTIY